MGQSTFPEVVIVLASQDIKLIEWKAEIHYCADNNLTLVSIKIQFNIIL